MTTITNPDLDLLRTMYECLEDNPTEYKKRLLFDTALTYATNKREEEVEQMKNGILFDEE